MSGTGPQGVASQLDLLAARVERITVEPTPEVIRLGARRAPDHECVPSKRPKDLHSDEEWLFVLRFAEELIRWRSWTHPHPLPLDRRPDDCVGGAGRAWYDGKGVAIAEQGKRRYASWPALLRGLREQREREPHIADARDLAAAYHAAEQYHRFYLADPPEIPVVAGGWCEEVAEPHFDRLLAAVADLGGDPGFCRTNPRPSKGAIPQ